MHPLTEFLIRPSAGQAVEAVRTAVEASGITEVKVRPWLDFCLHVFGCAYSLCDFGFGK